MIATLFTHPIDTLKLRQQLHGLSDRPASMPTSLTSPLPQHPPHSRNIWRLLTNILRYEGPSALYAGLSPAILRAATYSATRLGLYDPLRTWLNSALASRDEFGNVDLPSTPSFTVKFAASVTSGALGAIVGNPFELIKVRMQQNDTNAYRNAFDALRRITTGEGVFALWTGTYPAILRGALLTSSQLATYDQTKTILKTHFLLEEGILAHLSAAMMAGIVTTTVSTPADVVKSLVMHSYPTRSPLECMRHIFATDGLRGFMRGWTPNYARLGPHSLITMVVYENLRSNLGLSSL